MHRISVAGIEIDVIQKNIKNLHLGVYPPNGKVRISAPLGFDDDSVRMAVISRLGWIRKKQKEYEGQDRQSPREYLSRESHYFFGQRYLLNIVETEGKTGVFIRNKTYLDLYVPKNSDFPKKSRVLTEWYRRELKSLIPPLIKKWEPVIGVEMTDWGVKKMKTKWGSCNPKAGRIWVNLELAKKPPLCLEYIIVHEMVHLLERHHNDNFRELMDHFMPQWKLYRDELNKSPLAHESWDY
ncbi:MAG: M48 family metallopeptidase [Methanomicrobiaceae archaeon]|nr:M48 family metallopeptidase [Methanomicrobiaceae archaeon]